MATILAHLLNTALALLFWLIIGRAALNLLSRSRQNFFTGLFEKGTEPVYELVRRATRHRASDRSVVLLTLALTVLLRLALLPALRNA
ncbi:MAG: YggT family protein [Egibacteraceae bacterium]